MKKVLFLMFLLLLMGLGAAGVKAQVRIGGDAAPNPAAVLDLNADDINTGTKGLALLRVSLTNVSTPLTGTPVVNGMMVYNTNASATGGSGVGIYYWAGTRWVYVITQNTTLPGVPVSWSLVLDTTMTMAIPAAPGYASFAAPTLTGREFCTCNASYGTLIGAGGQVSGACWSLGAAHASAPIRFVCLRPSM